MAPPNDPPGTPAAPPVRPNPRPSTLPEPVWQTLLRSYDKKTPANWNLCQALGYHGVDERPGVTVNDMVDRLDKNGVLGVILRVYARIENPTESRSFPGIWSNIDVILNGWDVVAGKGVSEGFAYVAKNRMNMSNLFRLIGPSSLGPLRGSGPYAGYFCEDDPSTTVHGDRDCFREMIKMGPGLHVCVARQRYNPADTATFDDIHVDVWQVPSTRTAMGRCDYHYATQGFAKHMVDVIPWWVGDQTSGVGNWLKDKTSWGSTKDK